MLADRPLHVTSRPRVFPCPGIVVPHLNTPVIFFRFHKLKAGALAHALPSLWIFDSIDRNSLSGTATSAIWNTVILE